MPTPAEEDRAADLARLLNEAGIHADPGVTGGVVIYATAAQAELFLASLVPAAAQIEHDQVAAAEVRRHAGNIRSELSRFLEELGRLENVRRTRLRRGPRRPVHQRDGPDMTATNSVENQARKAALPAVQLAGAAQPSDPENCYRVTPGEDSPEYWDPYPYLVGCTAAIARAKWLSVSGPDQRVTRLEPGCAENTFRRYRRGTEIRAVT
jgi:hypothetical protein